MQRILTRSVFIAILCVASFICKADPSTDSLISRYRSFLLESAIDAAKISRWTNALQDGKWNDINYEDQTRGSWKTREHLERVQMMSIAWAKPGSSYYENDALLQSILQALDHWLQHKYQNSNWWHNEIGVPQFMRDIIILLKAQLSATQLSQSLAVLRQLKVGGTGANLAWTADLGLHYAALANDRKGIDSCHKLLINEIMISTKEGVQPDFSFHQHGARLQNFHYGRSFLTDNTRLAWQCRNTVWAFPQEKVMILAQLLLEGDQWMSRGKFVAPGVIDRAISRAGFLDTGDLSLTAQQLKDLVPGISKQLDDLMASYKGKKMTLGYKPFPYSDFAAYNDNRYSFYLKTISARTLSSETTTNAENLKGQLLNGGNTYFVKNGREYTDLMPVWDWNKLPGITNFNEHGQLARRAFNGGIGNKVSGFWAMDYSVSFKEKELGAHKFWAVYDNVVVCLIAGIKQAGDPDSIFTVLDQSRLQTSVIQNKENNVIPNGTQVLNNTNWIYHAGFAYMPLYKEPLVLKTGKVSGTWYEINNGMSKEVVEDSIFLPMILHKKERLSAGSGYVVAACKDGADAQQLFAKPSWKIISNNDSCQAVSFKNEMIMIAFFKKGMISWKKKTIRVDRACLLLIENDQLYAADPEHKGGEVSIELGGKVHAVQLSKTGEVNRVPL